jgi:hypothetical protein
VVVSPESFRDEAISHPIPPGRDSLEGRYAEERVATEVNSDVAS